MTRRNWVRRVLHRICGNDDYDDNGYGLLLWGSFVRVVPSLKGMVLVCTISKHRAPLWSGIAHALFANDTIRLIIVLLCSFKPRKSQLMKGASRL